MSTRTNTLPGRRPVGDERGPDVRPPGGGRDRRSLLLVASVAVVAASIAGFSALYASADHKVAAVVVVHPVAQGQKLAASDLSAAQVAVSPGVAFLPLDEIGQVTGKRAAVAIPAGTLLTSADLTSAPAIANGNAVVGVALKDGTFPSGGLAPGDQVLVVQTAAAGAAIATPSTSGAPSTATTTAGALPGLSLSAGAAGTGVLVPQATVFGTGTPGSTSSGSIVLLVSLEVPTSVAAQVVTAAAAGQIGLVLLPQSTETATTTRVASSAPSPGTRTMRSGPTAPAARRTVTLSATAPFARGVER